MYSRGRYLFIALLVFSVLLMTLQSKTRPINPLSFLSYPFNSLNAFYDDVRSLLLSPVDAMRMASHENIQLRAELAELRQSLQEYEEMKLQNERLRALLDLKAGQPGHVTTASLVSKGVDQWVRTALIDKGSSDGIKKDMAVIVPQGLVGKIVRVWPSYAEMLLINDSSFSVSVRLQESRVEAIMSGSGGEHCFLKYISNDVDVHVGDVLVTSGLDAFYPKGIPVGTVRSVRKTTPELFQYVEVMPFVDQLRLEEVIIIER